MTRKLRARDERGAAAIFLALVTCFVLLPITAFTVDIGMQRVTRRDAQAVADAAAQDAARALGTGVATSRVALEAIARTTAEAVTTDLGSTPAVTLWVGTLTPAFESDQSLGCGPTHFNSYFTPTATGGVPDAVLVVVKNAVAFNFFSGDGGVCRSAIARAYESACMVMDSYAAALRSEDSSVLGPLTGILGTSLDTTVLSSSGILSADINVFSFLDILKTELNLGTVDEVLATNITAAQLMQAQASALSQQGASAATLSALDTQFTNKLGPLASKPPGINVGELLGITQGGASALGTTVNAFDLAAAGVQLANGTTPVEATLGLPPGLSGATLVDVSIGSRPTRVCAGEGKKTMGQTSVAVSANVLSPGSLVGNLVTSLTGGLSGTLCSVLGPLTSQSCFSVPTVSLGPISASVSLASASGEVLGLNCTGATANSMSVLEEASLAPVAATIPLTITQTRTFGSALNRQTETRTATFTLRVTTDATDKSVPATLSVDQPGDFDTGRAGPSGDLSVPSLEVETTFETNGAFSNTSGTTIINGTLASLSSVLNSISADLLTPLLTTAVDPLVKALTNTLEDTVGLTIAGSTYMPLRTPGCGTPALVG